MIRRVEASGLEALALVTELAHRARLADPTAGLWEAADFQWWWRMPRPSDEVAQTFWLDADGPVAGVLLTTWREAWGLDPMVVPGSGAPSAPPLAEIVGVGVERADGLGIERIETQVRDDDEAMAEVLASRGFAASDDHGGVTWMDASRRLPAPPVPPGFELADRSEAGDTPHPMERRNGAEVGPRLRQVPLYDPALDLAIRVAGSGEAGGHGEAAGYALFWFDPGTKVGMLEPMRVEDAWQRRGLARTLLLHGLARLADRGATRFKVSYETEPARALYTGAGFEIEMTDTAWVRDRGGGGVTTDG
ncbi:MAG TPA: GNAT family N-acetyltransferase [Candidatus Limnocylindrales bacterium]|nr:GNAT family N-acetyltransferase [Candidatus Limnocylindrales bacterium]